MQAKVTCIRVYEPNLFRQGVPYMLARVLACVLAFHL
jgi:hypothetical protein